MQEKDQNHAMAGGATPKALSVKTQIAASPILSADIEVPGTILPNESTEIHAEVSDAWLNVYKEGAKFQKRIVAKLYDGDLQAQLRKSTYKSK